MERLHERLETVKTHDFYIRELKPYQKDGGVFVRFTYTARDHQNALDTLQKDLQLEANKHGGLPSWSGLNYCNVWLVKGEPFLEVRFRKSKLLDEIANQVIRICIDIHQELSTCPSKVQTFLKKPCITYFE